MIRVFAKIFILYALFMMPGQVLALTASGALILKGGPNNGAESLTLASHTVTTGLFTTLDTDAWVTIVNTETSDLDEDRCQSSTDLLCSSKARLAPITACCPYYGQGFVELWDSTGVIDDFFWSDNKMWTPPGGC